MNVKKILPQGIRNRIWSILKNQLIKIRQESEKKYPQYTLDKIHLSNARLLMDRNELLTLLPHKGVVAELGVDEGDYSADIISHNQPLKLHLVDLWSSQRYNTKKKVKVQERFSKEIENGSVEINFGLSTVVSEIFPDNYFDWIYIDTTHAYEQTLLELHAYKPKMKENGVIAGHDFVRWAENGLARFGVIEAVSEFCVKENWEFLYLTMENSNLPSFAIRSLKSPAV